MTEVELPDGTILEVEYGASDSEIQRQVKAYMTQKDATAYAGGRNPAEMGTGMRFLGGAKHAWDKAALGLKGLVPGVDLSQEDKDLLRQGRAFVEKGDTAASVGQFTGDVATTAAPSTRAYQAVKAVTALPKALNAFKSYRALAAGGAVAGSGAAVGAAVAPEDRAEGAKEGAIGGLIGEGAGRLLTKALSGPLRGAVTKDAAELLDQGVPVPLWKATDNQWVRTVGERAKVFPLVGNMMRSQERNAIQKWNKLLAERSSPPKAIRDDAGAVLRWEKDKVSEIGNEGIEKLRNNFNTAYDTLFDGRVLPLDETFEAAIRKRADDTKAYYPGVADRFEGALAQVNDIIRPGTEKVGRQTSILGPDGKPLRGPASAHQGVTYETFKRARAAVDKRIDAAWQSGDSEMAERLMELRDDLDELRTRGTPPEVAGVKADIDSAYTNFKRLQRAAGSAPAMKEKGIVTPAQVVQATRALDKTPNKSMSAEGKAPLQREAVQANDVLGSTLPEIGPGTAEKMLVAGGVTAAGLFNPYLLTGAALATPSGQRLLQGGFKFQGALRRKPDILADVLRSYGVATAADDQE
jgi:hypothetical protein